MNFSPYYAEGVRVFRLKELSDTQGAWVATCSTVADAWDYAILRNKQWAEQWDKGTGGSPSVLPTIPDHLHHWKGPNGEPKP